MKKAKWGLFLLILALVVAFVVQNRDFLSEKHTFSLDLWKLGQYETPEIANGVYYTIFFLAGWLITYIYGLSDRFSSRRVIKDLTATIDSHRDVISSMEIELNALKGRKEGAGAEAEKPLSSPGTAA